MKMWIVHNIHEYTLVKLHVKNKLIACYIQSCDNVSFFGADKKGDSLKWIIEDIT